MIFTFIVNEISLFLFLFKFFVFLIFWFLFFFFFFFFQAEDGIRDKLVTGVQTCALPIWLILSGALHNFNMYALGSFLSPLLMRYHGAGLREAGLITMVVYGLSGIRSEERRVGKECRSRWLREH